MVPAGKKYASTREVEVNCLSCRHLLVCDFESEREFVCGHGAMSELDSNDRSPVIVALAWNSDGVVDRPEWCPLPRPEPSVVQRELFADEE